MPILPSALHRPFLLDTVGNLGGWLQRAQDVSDSSRLHQDLYTLNESFRLTGRDDWHRRSSSLLQRLNGIKAGASDDGHFDDSGRLFWDVIADVALAGALQVFFSSRIEKWRVQTEVLRNPELARRALEPTGPEDVLMRIAELPSARREPYRRWLANTRALGSIVKTSGVAERVLFEFARTGDIAQALEAELPLADVEAQLGRLAAGIDPLSPADSLLKSDLSRRLAEAQERPRIRYREFERMNVEAVFLADASVDAVRSRERLRGKTPEEFIEENTSWPSISRPWETALGMTSGGLRRFLVPVYVSEPLDEIEVFVPGAGAFPVEVVFEPTWADGAPRMPWYYSLDHDRGEHLDLALQSLDGARTALSGPWPGPASSATPLPLLPEEGLALLNAVLEQYTLPVLRTAARDPSWWAVAGRIFFKEHHGRGEPAVAGTFSPMLRLLADQFQVLENQPYAAFGRELERSLRRRSDLMQRSF